MVKTFGGSIALLAVGLAELTLGVHGTLAQNMGPASIQLPAEAAQLKPGPGLESAQNDCRTCHSVDYIYMQPPLAQEQWQGDLMKMNKAMGTPIPDIEVDKIVQYLTCWNGKK